MIDASFPEPGNTSLKKEAWMLKVQSSRLKSGRWKVDWTLL